MNTRQICFLELAVVYRRAWDSLWCVEVIDEDGESTLLRLVRVVHLLELHRKQADPERIESLMAAKLMLSSKQSGAPSNCALCRSAQLQLCCWEYTLTGYIWLRLEAEGLLCPVRTGGEDQSGRAAAMRTEWDTPAFRGEAVHCSASSVAWHCWHCWHCWCCSVGCRLIISFSIDGSTRAWCWEDRQSEESFCSWYVN